MQLSIKYKILAVVFASILIAVGGMWLLVSWSFDRGFVGYVSSTEQEMHANLVKALAEEYRAAGGWDTLRGNERRWRELHLESFLKSDLPRYAHRYAIEPPDVMLRPGRAFTAPLPPPDGAPEMIWHGKEVTAFPPEDSIQFVPGKPGADVVYKLRRRKARTALFDAERQPVFGSLPTDEQIDYQPVAVDGRTVGYLGIRARRIPDGLEQRFSERQARTFMLIAMIMMLVAAVVGLPLSQRLVNPLRSLSDATRRLAGGDYSARTTAASGDELGQLARDFNTLAHTLEQNEKSRRQWIADISHELRTPLAVLRGEIEALQDGVRQPTPERLGALHAEAMNLARLVDDLYELSLSDIGALSYRKQPLDLRAIIETATQNFADRLAERRLELALQLPPQPLPVLGDPDRLQQLCANLLSNSLRYTDPGGRVQIAARIDSGSVIIELQDSAPGVEAEHLPRLFERLYRVEGSRNRATGGAGLGLAIARNIVEAHGGSIAAESSSLGGLCVRVRLPLDA